MNYKGLVTEFYYGFETAANESTRSIMLASAHTVYEVRRIRTYIRACVSIVGGAIQRCMQEYQQDAWESRHAYPDEQEASMGSLSLVEDLTIKKCVGLPCPNWPKAGGALLMSPRQCKTSQHRV